MSAAPTYDEIRMPVPVPGRPAYVPEWSPRFSEAQLRLEVKSEGRPLGFTISSVMPERRWAIDPESGELMDVKRFEELYQKWKSRFFENGNLVHIGDRTKYFDPGYIPVPNIVEFVNCKLDSFGKEVPIDYDPDRPAPEQVQKVLFTQDGEVAQAAASEKSISAKLEMLTEMLEEGEIDQAAYVARVTRLTSGEDVPVERKMPAGFDSVQAEESEDEEKPAKKMHWKTREKLEREARAKAEAGE